MERDFRIEAEQSGDLVGDDFGRMVVTVVHQRQNTVMSCCEGEGEFSGAGGERFNTDTEDLGFDARLDEVLVKRFFEDRFDGFLVAHTRTHTVSGNILVAVTGPDVHNAGIAGFLCKVFGNADTSLTVFDPECTNFCVGAGQGQTVLGCHGMGEERRVEVDTHVVLLCELDPLCKVLRFDLIAVDIFAFLEDRVACVDVELLGTGAEGHCLFHVSEELCRSGSLAGVVTGGLDTAGERTVMVETDDVVTLPAVQSNGDVLQLCDGSIGINAVCSIHRFCGFISGHDRVLLFDF